MPSQEIQPSNTSLVYTLKVRFVEEDVQHDNLIHEIAACIEEDRELALPSAYLQQKRDVESSTLDGFEQLSITQSLTRYESESKLAEEVEENTNVEAD